MVKRVFFIVILLMSLLACKPDIYADKVDNTSSVNKVEYISKELPKRGIYKLCIDNVEYIAILDREAVCITQVLDNKNKPKLCNIE